MSFSLKQGIVLFIAGNILMAIAMGFVYTFFIDGVIISLYLLLA